MYYRLSDNIAFRYWPDAGYMYYEKGSFHAKYLTVKQAQIMLMCGSEHDIDTDDTVMLLALRKIITCCEKGEKNSEWSSFKKYNNKFFQDMNLMITGKCNYNCLHCFNAVDNSALMTEWSLEDLCTLLDQAENCGINGFQLTGGEPMMHKNFLDIVREIYKRNMMVFLITTNGYFITQEILDELKAIGCYPKIRISFDGIGPHDWMRGFKGAETRTLDAVRLCVENGFSVETNTQANRRNVHTIMPTAKLLDSIGVKSMRISRTTEVPRWVQNAPNASLTIEEYYEKMLEFAVEYVQSGISARLYVCQYLRLLPDTRSFYMNAVKSPEGMFYEDKSCCLTTNYMTAVTSSGEVMPCNQMSGFLAKKGISLGNVHKTPLSEILSSGSCVNIAKMTVGQVLRNSNNKCSKCSYFKYCGGGGRALGLLFSDGKDFVSEDITKCCFFEDGWYQKVTRALSGLGWRNLSEIAEI